MVYRANIFKTLLYFDLFNFPPNKEEVWQFLQGKMDYKIFEKTLKEFSMYKSFYFLNRKKIVNQRIAKEKTNKNKIKKAIKIAQKLRLVPTIKFIGISGSLSMKNAQDYDDIDIFIITEKNSVWISRFISILVLLLLGVYRRKNDKNVKNKICLNFLIDVTNLKFQKNKQNLYTAHEIVQLLPLIEKDDTYANFINSNYWIEKYLPNFRERTDRYKLKSYNTPIIEDIFIGLFNILHLEQMAKILQFNYMKQAITVEKIENGFLAFHPINYEKETLNSLNLRLKNKLS